MASTTFGSVAVSDGYPAPVPLLPGAPVVLSAFVPGDAVVGPVGSFLCLYDGSIDQFQAYAAGPPVGSKLVLDLLVNEVSIFAKASDRPAIATGSNFAGAPRPGPVAIAPGDRLRVDVLQVGSTTPGSGLHISVGLRVSGLA